MLGSDPPSRKKQFDNSGQLTGGVGLNLEPTRLNFDGGGGGGGGVPASDPENIIRTAAQLKTDRIQIYLENKTSAWVYSCSSSSMFA